MRKISCLEAVEVPILHKSDCAVHNEPALPAGPCSCGVHMASAVTYRMATPDDLLFDYGGSPTELAAYDDAQAIVAEADGQIIGNIIYEPGLYFGGEEPENFVNQAFVLPAYRRQGIYRTLVQMMLDRVPDQKPSWELGGNPVAHDVIRNEWERRQG